jgi:hypothetical protein
VDGGTGRFSYILKLYCHAGGDLLMHTGDMLCALVRISDEG